MDYKQTLEYLFSQLPVYHLIGAAAYKADLSNTLALCKVLGNPHKNLLAIHVAGTNGKGSVSHFLASILQESGYKTGLFTSPHLKDFRERIRMNGAMIPEEIVVQFVEKHLHDFEKIKPSFFEWTAALAFDHFRNEKVDIAVIETGLGGRLDSTNVITPVISLITNIGWDHSNFLGDTLEKIAFEKAGIIKENIPVVIGETQKHSSAVFTDVARARSASIVFADQVHEIEKVDPIQYESDLLKVSVTGNECRFSGANFEMPLFIESGLTGIYQLKNILSVLTAVEELIKKGYAISQIDLQNGFRNVVKNTGMMGRWQVLSEDPLTICDTGHNEDGIREIVTHLREIRMNKLHIVFGMVQDKDVKKILALLPKKAVYYFCQANIPRALSDEALSIMAQQSGLKGSPFGSVRNALQEAQMNAGMGDVIFVGGSTFVVAEAL